jgi:nitroreductase
MSLLITPDDVLKALRWRYATKKFDPARVIPTETWSALEECLRLAPSSFGVQPWRFVVVGDPNVRTQLRAASWNQAQVVEASHLVVFARRSPVTPEDIERHAGNVTTTRQLAPDAMAGYRGMVEGFIGAPGFDSDAWAARQTYLALGFFLAAAAILGIDTCPMEGIETAKYDAILDLPARGYRALVAAAVGYRAKDDAYAAAAKVRFAPADVIERR